MNIGFLLANPIDKETAKTVAKNFMNDRRSISNNIKNVVIEELNGEISFFVINFQLSGWVMVSADNSVIPVLSYSLVGEYRLDDNKPEAFIELINGYKEQIENAEKLKSINNTEIIKRWDNLINKKKLKSLKTYTPGSQLLNVPDRGHVQWSQDENNSGGCSPSYNEFCPDKNCDDGCNDRAPAGCGPVAMGQIMWYWQWPTATSYRTYDWNLMPNELTNSSTDPEGNEIAHLLRDIGKDDAANMLYNCWGTFNTVGKLIDGFKKFKYKGVVERVKKNWNSDVWGDIIRTEIDAERPVLYRGDKSVLSGKKHYFVIDGYDVSDPDYFWFNFGWGYPGNSYNISRHYLNNIVPGDHEYNKNQKAIVGISPTCTGVPDNINDVDYTVVTDTKSEYARNIISLPSDGKSLTVKPGGNLTLSAGNTIILKPGFSAEAGSNFEASISQHSVCIHNCGLQLMHIDNAILKGNDDASGWFEIRAVNVTTYDFYVVNRWGNVIYQTAGSLDNNITTTIWEGEGASMEGVYVGHLSLRNNCGEKISKTQDITVLMGDNKKSTKQTKSAPLNTKNNSENKVFSENHNTIGYNDSIIMSSNGFIIFPNPSSGHFNIKTSTKSLPYSISIANSLGKVVYKKNNINSEIHKIIIDKDLSGFLIATIISNNKKYFNKIIIK